MRAHPTIAIACVVALAGTAHGEDRLHQAKRQVEAADIDYRLGRFTAALAEYTRAYELYPVPALLFNIGQCHKNLKDHAKAVFFFEGYLRDAPTAANRALVEDLIRELKAELDRPAPSEPAAPPHEPAPPPPAVVVRVEPAASRDAAPSRVGPGLLIGGGLAAAATGAVLYYYGQKRGSEEMYVYDDTRWVGGATMALGGAAIVVGAVLWRRTAAAPVAALAPGGAYLGWAGWF